MIDEKKETLEVSPDGDVGEQSSVRQDEKDLAEPENALPEMRLEDLSEDMRDAASRAGWPSLMPVQAKAIPYILAGRDLMVQSRTGSGKTGAFILPIQERIDPQEATCQALILVPTRELAQQVATESEMLAGDDGVRTVAVYGGVAYGPQIDGFQKGAHLTVGTPGRVLDHLLKGTLSLKGLKILVFDEADRMLSMGFYPDMKRLREFLPNRNVDGFMFSATFPSHVKRLAAEFMTDPGFLSLSRDRVHVTDTDHVFYRVPPMDKDRALVRIIETENPASGIIFCNTKQRVNYVSVVLQRFGYDADQLSADLTQAAREKVLTRLREGTLRFLVATDVAARGIDISALSHVFLYEVPQDPESYIHRAGRTGRVGASGVAVSLTTAMEQLELQRIAKRYHIDLVERPLPSNEDVEAIVAQRVVAMLEARLRTRDNVQAERFERFIPLARSLGDNEDEAPLIAMLLDDYYQQSLHAAPPQPDESLDSGTKKAKKSSSTPKTSSHKPRGRESHGGGRGGRGRRR